MSVSASPSDVRFVGVSLDCADPAELAEFYLQMLGGRLLWSRPTSVGVQVPGLLLIPQRVENYRPPEWPGASIVHLDLTAGEHLDEPVKRTVALGARPADPQPEPAVESALGPRGSPVLHHHLGAAPPSFSRPERCKREPRPGRSGEAVRGNSPMTDSDP